MKRKCRNCKYYHKADYQEYGSDGCYYWCEGSEFGFCCYKTERILIWLPLFVSMLALIRSIFY